MVYFLFLFSITNIFSLTLFNYFNCILFIFVIPLMCPLLVFLQCLFTFLKNKFIYLFIYFWLSWVFVAAHGLSLVVVSGGYSLLRCAGSPLRWLLLLRSTGSRPAGFSSCGMRASVVVARGLSCSSARGILLDQGLNPCPLHWQADS